MQIQHGDVIIRGVTKIPKGARRLGRDGCLVVMEGEETGHSHIITGQTADLWTLEKDGVTQLYLEVAEPVTITHEEHKPLEIPTGIYEIGRVKEYDYFKEMERYVVD
jgi:hypothetical protein